MKALEFISKVTVYPDKDVVGFYSHKVHPDIRMAKQEASQLISTLWTRLVRVEINLPQLHSEILHEVDCIPYRPNKLM